MTDLVGSDSGSRKLHPARVVSARSTYTRSTHRAIVGEALVAIMQFRPSPLPAGSVGHRGRARRTSLSIDSHAASGSQRATAVGLGAVGVVARPEQQACLHHCRVALEVLLDSLP